MWLEWGLFGLLGFECCLWLAPLWRFWVRYSYPAGLLSFSWLSSAASCSSFCPGLCAVVPFGGVVDVLCFSWGWLSCSSRADCAARLCLFCPVLWLCFVLLLPHLFFLVSFVGLTSAFLPTRFELPLIWRLALVSPDAVLRVTCSCPPSFFVLSLLFASSTGPLGPCVFLTVWFSSASRLAVRAGLLASYPSGHPPH